jgi:hypothetical protein
MRDFNKGLIVGNVIALIINLTLNLCVFSGEYKKGQVDAINGKIMYHHVTNSNYEIIWERKGDVK